MWSINQRVIYENKKDKVRLIGTIVDIIETDRYGETFDLLIQWDNIGGVYTYKSRDGVTKQLAPYIDPNLSADNPNKTFLKNKERRSL